MRNFRQQVANEVDLVSIWPRSKCINAVFLFHRNWRAIIMQALFLLIDRCASIRRRLWPFDIGNASTVNLNKGKVKNKAKLVKQLWITIIISRRSINEQIGFDYQADSVKITIPGQVIKRESFSGRVWQWCPSKIKVLMFLPLQFFVKETIKLILN